MQHLIEKLAAAFKPLPEEKILELLEKIRKGQTSGFNLRQYVACLTYLGWRVEPSTSEIEVRWGYPKPDTVERVPSIKITSPNGKVFHATVDSGAFVAGITDPYKMKQTFALQDWLRDNTPWERQVAERLSRPTFQEEEAEKAQAKAVSRENTGTCPCCFRNVKLKSSPKGHVIVLHGYKRPGWGSVQGRCHGVGFPPFEESPQGTKNLVDVLEAERETLKGTRQKFLSPSFEGPLQLQRGNTGRPQPVYPYDGAKWQMALQSAVSKINSDLNILEEDLRKLPSIIASWEPRPLTGKALPIPSFLD